MRALWLALVVVPLAACTSGEDIALLHREITDVQRNVQQLRASSLDKTELGPVEQRLSGQGRALMRSNAELAARVDRLQGQLEALRGTVEVTSHRLDSLSQEVAASRVMASPAPLPPVTTGEQPAETGGTPADASQAAGAVTPPPSPTPMPQTPDDLYRSAYQDYMRGNYELARQGFAEYLRRYPDTDLADNALYWVGECYDAQDQPEKALESFSEVLEKYPTSDKAAAAQLKKGLVYLKMDDQGQGVVNLQYVVYEHPGTKEADLARERLRSLGITIR